MFFDRFFEREARGEKDFETINNIITGDHSKQDQISLVKVDECIGFRVYRRSYLLWSPVILLLLLGLPSDNVIDININTLEQKRELYVQPTGCQPNALKKQLFVKIK